MENKKPTMCKIVGVEPNQRYAFPGGLNGPYYVDEKGHNRDKYGHTLSDEDIPYWEDAVNQGYIQLVERYSIQEKEIMRHMLAVGYTYMARDNLDYLQFFSNLPKRAEYFWEAEAKATAPKKVSSLFPRITWESEPVDIKEALA